MTDQEIIDYLVGTCNSIGDLSNKEQDRFDEDDFCNRLDSQVFNCCHCSWWCSIDEVETSSMGELVCVECKEEENND